MTDIKIIGTKFHWDKFDKLKSDNWKMMDYSKNMYECKLHNTIFNPNDEPCWGCHNLCEEIISEEK